MEDKEYQKSIGTPIENSVINKVNEHDQSVIHNDKCIDSYELNDLTIHGHLLIKTFEEINQQLKKHNGQFRTDFDVDAYKYFDEINYNYFKKEGCIADDGGLFLFKNA